jgi:hypothetical protein
VNVPFPQTLPPSPILSIAARDAQHATEVKEVQLRAMLSITA